MMLSKGVYAGKQDDGDLFVGWGKAPGVDRRFLLAATPLALAGAAGAGYAVASALDDPGAGAWFTNATHKVRGVVEASPYPMIRVADPSAPFGMRTVLVVSEGKCTSGLELQEAAGGLADASGVLIERGARRMLEVPLTVPKWLSPVAEEPDPLLVGPAAVSLGTVNLAGMVMDSKCFFGVMKPARGRTHKACASLCIRGGIPPSFWVRARGGREAVLLMTDRDGGPIGEEILPLVAEASEARGEIVRVGDLLQFRADVDAYRRV